MTYDSFERSAAPDGFEDFNADDALVVWLDLLGTSNLSHEVLGARIKALIEKIKEVSATGPVFDDGAFIGTPNTALQYSVIGDAVAMTQKHRPDTPYASQLGLLVRTIQLSTFLFQQGIPHRAVVVRGSVKCIGDENAKIITGSAVVRAVHLEKRIKALGIFCHRDTKPFFEWYRNYSKKKLDSLSMKSLGWYLSPFLPEIGAVLWGKELHFDAWKTYIESDASFRVKSLVSKHMIKRILRIKNKSADSTAKHK